MGDSAQVFLEALGERHIGVVVGACSGWVGLAESGPPYWRPRSEAELRRKVQSMAGPGLSTEYNFIVTTGGRPVGECSVHAIDYRNRVGQLGVCIWEPTEREHGLGSAAVSELVRWATDYLGLRRLEAWIVAGNAVSEQLFGRLGFVHEGTLRSRYLANGVWRDFQIYGFLTHDPATDPSFLVN